MTCVLMKYHLKKKDQLTTAVTLLYEEPLCACETTALPAAAAQRAAINSMQQFISCCFISFLRTCKA